jgi:hypothetical protein
VAGKVNTKVNKRDSVEDSGLIVWHYTTGECLVKILRDGYIKPATAFVARGERPIVWFSRNPTWERTANKMWRKPDGSIELLDREGTRVRGGGLVRIGVTPATAPFNWRDLKEQSRMSAKIARALYQTAINKGARPSDWYGTFDVVPRHLWVAVERLDGENWVPIELSDSPPEGLAKGQPV